MTNTLKINKAKIRRDIAESITKKYIASGQTWSCAAQLYNQIRAESMEKAIELDKAGIVLSKSSYSFNVIPSTSEMFMSDVYKNSYTLLYGKKSL